MKMKVLLLVLSATVALALWAQAGATGIAVDDADDFEEEIVIRRKKRRPASVVVAPVAPVVSAAPAETDEPPPPEPPAAEAAEPRRLVRYFCKMWKDEDWERLWWAMEPGYRKRVPLRKFRKIFEDDAEGTGGLKDENILEEGQTDSGEGVKVELIFKYPRARHRIVLAVVRRIPGGGYRVAQSPLIPLDFDDL